jgi:hypothetical protein
MLAATCKPGESTVKLTVQAYAQGLAQSQTSTPIAVNKLAGQVGHELKVSRLES